MSNFKYYGGSNCIVTVTEMTPVDTKMNEQKFFLRNAIDCQRDFKSSKVIVSIN